MTAGSVSDQFERLIDLKASRVMGLTISEAFLRSSDKTYFLCSTRGRNQGSSRCTSASLVCRALAANRSFIKRGLSRGPRETSPGLDVFGEVLGVPRHSGEPARAPGIEPRQT